MKTKPLTTAAAVCAAGLGFLALSQLNSINASEVGGPPNTQDLFGGHLNGTTHFQWSSSQGETRVKAIREIGKDGLLHLTVICATYEPGTESVSLSTYVSPSEPDPQTSFTWEFDSKVVRMSVVEGDWYLAQGSDSLIVTIEEPHHGPE